MYQYKECGLDNVWLANGYEVVETAYGPGVAVTAGDKLLQQIAAHLVRKPSRLTGKEFRFLRVELGLSQGAMAKVQGVSEQNVSLWERRGKVPKANDALLRLCYLAHAAGDASLRSSLEQIMTVERLVHQKIVATASRKGWKFTVEETEPTDEAPAVAG